MATYKIVGGDGKEYGPVSPEQMRQWLAQGRATSQTKVQVEGSAEWKTLADFPELSETVGVEGQPPPIPPSTPPPSPPSPPAKISGMAITSLVLGVLGLVTLGITALFGLILGIISMVRINRSQGRLRGFGVALAGTIVSGLFLLVLPIALAITLPALAKAKSKAQSIMCMNNLKQMGLGVIMYANDHNNVYPAGDNWCDAIKMYVGGSDVVFHCPNGDKSDQSHYALNKSLSGIEINAISSPAETVMIFECEGGWNVNGGSDSLLQSPRHQNAVGVVFADGHAEMVSPQRLQSLRWEP